MSHARRSAIFTAAFVAAAAIVSLILLRPRDEARATAGARPVPALGDFDTVEIRRAGDATTVRRVGGQLIVSAPVAAPADEAVARAAFTALEQLDFIALVTDSKVRQAELRVDDAAGVTVKVRRGDRALVELIVGQGSDRGTMVRVGGGDAVWQVGGNLREIFDKPTADWRDRTVSLFAADEAARIEVAARDGARIVLERGAKAGATWRVRESSVPIDKLDVLVPRELLATLATLKASDFADAVSPAAAGLVPPSLTVGVGLRDGRVITLEIGDATDRDEVFVATAGSPRIFRVKQFNVERIARRPMQFRDKTLCDISDADVIAFGVTQGPRSYAVARTADGWRATRPARIPLDPDQVSPLVSVFRGWRAPRIAEAPPPDAMSETRAVISARSNDARCTIRVGRDAASPAGIYVQTAGSPDVYVVPKWMIDRIAVPPGKA